MRPTDVSFTITFISREVSVVFSSLVPSLVPRPRPKIGERGVVTLANYLVCAVSAFYVTIHAFCDHVVASYC